MSRPWRWLFVALALPVAAAHADPITVTTGAVVIVGPFGLARVDVRGTDGFILTGLSEIHGFGFLCNSDCSPGQLFDPAGNLNEFEGTARLTVQGHPRNVHVDDNNSSFNFFAHPVVIPSLSTSAVLSAPFELRGLISLGDPDLFPTGSLDFPLTGRGTARIELINRPVGQIFGFRQSVYSFGAVPEPGTLALLSCGLGAFAIRRRRYPQLL